MADVDKNNDERLIVRPADLPPGTEIIEFDSFSRMVIASAGDKRVGHLILAGVPTQGKTQLMKYLAARTVEPID